MRMKWQNFHWFTMDLEWRNICLLISTFWGALPCYTDFCIQSESDQTQYTARQIKLSMGTRQKSYIQISVSSLQNKHIEVHNLSSPLSSIFLDKYTREYLWALCKIEIILAKFWAWAEGTRSFHFPFLVRTAGPSIFDECLCCQKRSLRCKKAVCNEQITKT